VGEVERFADGRTRETARALVTAVLDLHRAGLARILEVGGESLRQSLAGDPQASSLLLLHGLHPVPMADRVAQALGRASASLSARGLASEVESRGESWRVKLRWTGPPGNGGAQAAEELAAELARLAPDAAVEIEPAPRPEEGFVPIERLGRGAR
jgi:hypothetical protein